MDSAAPVDDPNFWDCYDRLGEHVPPDVAALVQAAFSTDPDALDQALRESVASGADTRPEPATPPPMYLSRIAVRGFRGIGAEATLQLPPGPGLVVISGRNGCGKSSFAEALELVLTGRNSRWATAARAQEMRGGWRNLHHGDEPCISLELTGSIGSATLAMRWPREVEQLEDGHFEARIGRDTIRDRGALGWTEALTTFRPILTYAALGDLTGQKDTELYDQLATTLGLDTLRGARTRLGAFGKRLKADEKAARGALDGLRPRLEALDDTRATEVLDAVRRQPWKLDRVEAVCGGLRSDTATARLLAIEAVDGPDAEALSRACGALRALCLERAALEGTAAGRSRELSLFLEHALRWHAGEPRCPLCGEGVLDGDWRMRSESLLEATRREARVARELDDAMDRSLRGLRQGLRPLPEALHALSDLDLPLDATRHWVALHRAAELADPLALAERVESLAPQLDRALGSLQARARQAREGRDALWREVSDALVRWLPGAWRAVEARGGVKRVNEASKLLVAFEKELMADRFSPIEERAKAIWDRLRQRSHVDLRQVALQGTHTSPRRGVRLAVEVDGKENVALGVMSQGELHSLALALFLPRLTHERSPFDFLVLDDPVQAMDPYKVDGLARVLEEAAHSRQVVVLTHDARLPEAVRRLRIEATLLRIERGANSAVAVHLDRDPVAVYLEEAQGLSTDSERLGPTATRRVIPGFCRAALEACFRQEYRRRALAEGTPHHEVEETWKRARGTTAKAALGLFGDATRAVDVGREIRRIAGDPGYAILKACKEGAHEGWDRFHQGRIEDTRLLIRAVRRSR